MTPPVISVVIPCFNAASTIGLQLEALRRQIDAPPFEVLIADNGSSDNLRAAVQPFLGLPDFQLRILDASSMQGSSFARNVGIGQALGDVIMCCDADDVVSRTWVRNGHLSSEAIDLWTGESILLREHVFEDGIDGVFDAFDAEPPSWTLPKDKQPGLFPVLMAGNFGAKTSTLRELGGFDQAFAHYGDDNDLAFRARGAGYPVPVAESVRIAYRGKFSLKERLRRGFRDAQARRLLLEIHDVTTASTVPPWPLDLARCLGATLLAPLRRGQVVADDLMLRWSHSLGNAYGAIRYRSARARPESMLSAGMRGAENDFGSASEAA